MNVGKSNLIGGFMDFHACFRFDSSTQGFGFLNVIMSETCWGRVKTTIGSDNF